MQEGRGAWRAGGRGAERMAGGREGRLAGGRGGGGERTHMLGRDAVGLEELGGVANVRLVAVVGVPAAARHQHGPVALQRV